MAVLARAALALAAMASSVAAAPESLRGAGNSSAPRRGLSSEGIGGRFVLSKRYNTAADPAHDFEVVAVPDENLTHSCSNYVDDGTTVFSRNGKLVLKVSGAGPGGKWLNSGRIMSKQAFKYGIFTFSAKIPKCNGIWPALWLLPGNTNGTGSYGDWPCSGEIDVLETVDTQSVGAFNLVAGHGASAVNGCGAQPQCGQCGSKSNYCTSTTMKDLEASFYEVEDVDCSAEHPSWREHLFVLNWQPAKLAVYVDPELKYDAAGHLIDIVPKKGASKETGIPVPPGKKSHPYFKEYDYADTPTWGAVSGFMDQCYPGVAGLGAPFDQPMKLVLNIAVGGYGGAPCSWGSASCTDPGACGGAIGSEMEVSDISVWERIF